MYKCSSYLKIEKFLNAIFNSSYHNINIVIKIKNSNIVKYKCRFFFMHIFLDLFSFTYSQKPYKRVRKY